MKTLVLLLAIVSGYASASNVLGTLKVEHSNTPKPTVIVAHGCDGSKNPSYSNWMKLISSWGYNTAMIDPFASRGYTLGICHRPRTVTPTEVTNDIQELVDYIKQQSWHSGKIAVIGFSHGGSTIMNIANNDAINGIDLGIAYYPSCYDKVWFGKRYDFIGRPYSNPKFPVQIHFGDRDYWTPQKQCQNIEEYEYYTYKNATHAFDMQYPARTAYGHFMEYNSEADQVSKARTREFLDRYMSK